MFIMGKITSAIITPVLAAGSTTSPYLFQVNITQRLCHSSCIGLQPSFFPVFSFKEISKVADNQYMVRVHLEGTIVYVPCDGNECCTKGQLISQDFSIPVASVNTPTSVTVEGGTPVNAIVGQPCQKCSRTFVSEAPLSLTIA